MNVIGAISEPFVREFKISPRPKSEKNLGKVLEHSGPEKSENSLEESPKLSGHYSRDWSEYVNLIGAICGPCACQFR